MSFVDCDSSQIAGISASIGLIFEGIGAIFPAHSPSRSICGECPSALTAKYLMLLEIDSALAGIVGSISARKSRKIPLLESTAARSSLPSEIGSASGVSTCRTCR